MAAHSSHDVADHRVLLTAEETADRLALSRTTVYELIRTGELRAVKVGRARRVPVAAIGEYVDSLLASDLDARRVPDARANL